MNSVYTRNYRKLIAAYGILIASSFFSFYIIYLSDNNHSQETAAVNVTGRQRMLSQLILRKLKSFSEQESLDLPETEITEFLRVHRNILNGEYSNEMAEFYSDVARHEDSGISIYYRNLSMIHPQNASEIFQLLEENNIPLIKDLDSVLSAFNLKAGRNQYYFHLLLLFLFILNALLASGSFFLIIVPGYRELNRNAETLRQAKADLQQYLYLVNTHVMTITVDPEGKVKNASDAWWKFTL